MAGQADGEKFPSLASSKPLNSPHSKWRKFKILKKCHMLVKVGSMKDSVAGFFPPQSHFSYSLQRSYNLAEVLDTQMRSTKMTKNGLQLMTDF
jgi:hypothetical protein